MPKKVARENWPVLIRDAHPGYISWDEFERKEQTLRANVAGTHDGNFVFHDGNSLSNSSGYFNNY